MYWGTSSFQKEVQLKGGLIFMTCLIRSADVHMSEQDTAQRFKARCVFEAVRSCKVEMKFV